MKKLLIISLLTVYVALSAGVNIFVHTCGGESTALLATSKVEDPCGCDDEADADKCCTSVLTTVQLDAAQKVSAGTVCLTLPVTETLPLIAGIAQSVDEYSLFNRLFTSFSPPPDDLCVVHSMFRI
ncbi:MAG: hypothetical protein KA247_10190 [Bacteroidetes bacterium]|nr:hypothetical protein [Bacteroidota bacterium]